MPLDLTHPSLHLLLLPTPSHLLQLPPSPPLPPSLLSLLSQPHPPSTLLSLSFTSAETSVILPSPVFARLEPELSSVPGYRVEGPWRTVRVRGPMELDMTGVMAQLAGPLREAGVAVFATSTWDTDYLMVHEGDAGRAVEALEKAGWVFDQE